MYNSYRTYGGPSHFKTIHYANKIRSYMYIEERRKIDVNLYWSKRLVSKKACLNMGGIVK